MISVVIISKEERRGRGVIPSRADGGPSSGCRRDSGQPASCACTGGSRRSGASRRCRWPRGRGALSAAAAVHHVLDLGLRRSAAPTSRGASPTVGGGAGGGRH